MGTDRIKQLLDQAKALKIERSDWQKSCKAGFEAEVHEAWKRKFPKRKFSMDISCNGIKGHPEKGNSVEHAAIYKRWQQKMTGPICEEFKAKLNALEALVVEEAAKIDFPEFDGLTLFYTVDSDTFRSMGSCMCKYAEFAAQDYVDKVKSYGLDAHLRKVLTWQGKDCCGHSLAFYNYEVWVSTDEIGVEILHRRPDKETMSEWVDKCDRMRVCPRVLDPFMTYEQEEAYRSQARAVSTECA